MYNEYRFRIVLTVLTDSLAFLMEAIFSIAVANVDGEALSLSETGSETDQRLVVQLEMEKPFFFFFLVHKA